MTPKQTAAQNQDVSIDPLLIDAKTISRLVSLSVRTIRRLHVSGQMPRPIHVGRMLRWHYVEIVAWAERGLRPEAD